MKKLHLFFIVASCRFDTLTARMNKPSRAKNAVTVNYMEYLTVRSIAGFINSIPLSLAHALTTVLARTFYYALAKRRKTAFENLDIAYGAMKSPYQKKQIAKASFDNIGLSFMELFRIRKTVRDGKKRFSFYGTEHLESALARGKGAIWVISHLGSWEYLAFLPFFKGYSCSVLAKTPRNPFIARWLRKLRSATGIIHLDKKNSIKTILRRLEKNEIVVIAIDQWAGPEGIASHFFGLETSTTSIPARLARKTGCALVPGYCSRKVPGRYEIHVFPAVPVCGNSENWEYRTTEVLNRQLEKQIMSLPGQWSWTHRRWKSLPVTSMRNNGRTRTTLNI